MPKQRYTNTKDANIEYAHRTRCTKDKGCDCPRRIRITINGERIIKTRPTQAAARSLLADLRRAGRQPEAPAIERVPTVGEAWDVWLDAADPVDGPARVLTRSRTPYGPRTLSCYRKAMNLDVLPVLRDVPVTDVTFEVLDQLLTSMLVRGRAATTINHAWTALSVVFNQPFVMRFTTNPVSMIRRVTERPKPKGGGRILTPEEGAAVLDAMTAWVWTKGQRGASDPRPGMRIFWALALYSGLRRDEILALQWEDVSLDARVLRVLSGKTEASKGTVPISDKLASELRRLDPDGTKRGSIVLGAGLPRRQLYDYSYKALEAASIERVQPHDSRRSFATLLAANGTQLIDLKDMMRHADSRTTEQFYIWDTPGSNDRKRGALNNVFG